MPESCPNSIPQPEGIRATSWRLRDTEIRFGRLPRLMGIVNVTPDSFSDGGRFDEPAAAVDQGLRLVAEGADLLDIGGESTRPYSSPVSESEELRRVLPVIQALNEQVSVPISIDTSKAKVAAEAIAAGAQIINDVTGLTGDPHMVTLAVLVQAGVCAMHMQGAPQTMQDAPQYENVVEQIDGYLRSRRDAMQQAGLAPARICLDPGIGFGKTLQHNLTLLAACQRHHRLGCPLLVGPSRKGFIGQVLGDKSQPRLSGTIGVCLALAQRGVQVLRVHDILPVRQALQLFEAAGGLDPSEQVDITPRQV